MSAPFTPDIPASGQSLGITKNPIKNNFSAIRQDLAQNHMDILEPSGTRGKHKFLQMPKQTSAPTVLSNEGGLYVKESPTSSGQNQLFYRRESNGAEFGMAFLKGSTVIPALGSTAIYDFGSTPSCYGIFEARVNASLNLYRSIQYIYVVGGTYNVAVFTNLTPPPVYSNNFGSSAGSLVFNGSVLTLVCSGTFPVPSTVDWTFTGTYFPT